MENSLCGKRKNDEKSEDSKISQVNQYSIELSYEDYNKIIDDHLNNLNYKKLKKKNKIIFDTETNGLSSTNDIIQIAYYIVDSDNNIIETPKSFYIKFRKNNPNGDAYKINGISEELLNQEGEEFEIAITQFYNDLENCDEVIGHNIAFDIKMINSNIKKYKISLFDKNNDKIENLFTNKKIVCTQKLYTEFLKPIDLEIKKKSPTEKPISKKLVNMYFNFFDKHIINAHNALSDVDATFECYKILTENKYKNILSACYDKINF